MFVVAWLNWHDIALLVLARLLLCCTTSLSSLSDKGRQRAYGYICTDMASFVLTRHYLIWHCCTGTGMATSVLVWIQLYWHGFLCFDTARLGLKIIIVALTGAIRDFYSLHREPSPTRTLRWPGCNRVKITCNMLWLEGCGFTGFQVFTGLRCSRFEKPVRSKKKPKNRFLQGT